MVLKDKQRDAKKDSNLVGLPRIPRQPRGGFQDVPLIIAIAEIRRCLTRDPG